MKKASFILIAVLFVAVNGWSQNLVNIIKIGYVDVEEVFNSYPGTADLRQKMKDERDRIQADIDKQKEIIEKLQKDFQINFDRLSEDDRQKREAELEYKKEILADQIDEANKKLSAMKEELTRPVYQKISEVIRKVSAEKGYSFVFKKGSDALLYFDAKLNITTDVKSRLSKELSLEDRN